MREHVTNLVRQIVHQLFVVRHADGYAVIILADVNCSAGCVGARRTPISNSLTEMYLLFKYLRPNEMRRQQIENFDAWAAVFARKTTDFEFSVTNEIIAKERFRHFIKVPELAGKGGVNCSV